MDGAPLNWLELVYAQHKTWIQIVHRFGEKNLAEDIVQEAYIALAKYARPDRIFEKNPKGVYQIRRGYMYYTLRSLYLQYYNKKKKVKKIHIDDEFTFLQLEDETDKHLQDQNAYYKLCLQIAELEQTWTQQEKNIYRLSTHPKHNYSLREIARRKNMSWVSVHNILKNLKEQIKQKLKEDYEDYKNGDYEHL